MKTDVKTATTEKEQLETEKRTTFSYLKNQEEQLEEYKTKIEELEKENRNLKRKVVPDEPSGSTADRLKDENEALIAQRNALSKKNESLLKDLERKTKELDKYKKDSEGSVSRLTETNRRFLDEQKDLEVKIEELEEKNERLLEDKNEIIFKQKEEIDSLKSKLKEKSSVANKFKELFSKKKEEDEKRPDVIHAEVQTEADSSLESSPSKVELGMRKYSKQPKNSFVNTSSNQSMESVGGGGSKELQDLQRKLKMVEKERMQWVAEKKESEENYNSLRRMLEKKDDQLEEMRVEIERLAGKL